MLTSHRFALYDRYTAPVSTRQSRRAELRKRRRDRSGHQRSFPWFTALVVAVVLVGGFAGARVLGVFDTTPVPEGFHNPADYRQAIKPGTQMPDQGNGHIADGMSVADAVAQGHPSAAGFTGYNSTPPTSGPHWPRWAQPGVFFNQQPDELLVHNLEHGYVVISYNELPTETLDSLKNIRERWPQGPHGNVKIIIQPHAGVEPGHIALTAWRYIDVLDTYDEERILRFIASHIDQGPENAP